MSRTMAELLAGVVMLAIIVWLYTMNQDEWKQGQTAPEVADVPKVNITPAKVEVFAPAAKKKLKLPTPVQDDPNKHVVSSTRVKDDGHDHTVTTIIDSTTGQSKTLDRVEPLPWLARESTMEVRMDYGIRTDIGSVWRVTATRDIIRSKELHFGLTATAYSDGLFYTGVGVAWRF